jgi:hypothetical protein
MTNEELRNELLPYIGERVKVTSSIVRSDTWVTLSDVIIRGDSVWCYGDGVAWAVAEDGLVVEREPICGTFDMNPTADRVGVVSDIKKLYGPMGRECRNQCICRACTIRHSAEYDVVRREVKARWNEARNETGEEDVKDDMDEVKKDLEGW